MVLRRKKLSVLSDISVIDAPCVDAYGVDAAGVYGLRYSRFNFAEKAQGIPEKGVSDGNGIVGKTVYLLKIKFRSGIRSDNCSAV